MSIGDPRLDQPSKNLTEMFSKRMGTFLERWYLSIIILRVGALPKEILVFDNG